MTDSALLKVDRATKHVDELNTFLRKTTPFVFVVTTNTKTGERLLFIKENEPITSQIALICGDIVHNLRSALDHVYWEIVSPHCAADEERRVQFPFTRKAKELGKTLHDGYAQRAGTGFYCAMLKLRPHGEPGGNKMLFDVHELDRRDKHRLLVPTVDHTAITNEELRRLVSDWPSPPNRKLIIRGFRGKFRWINFNVPQRELGRQISAHEFEREVKLPTKVTLEISQPGNPDAIVPALNQMVDTVRQTISLLREAANSY